jgi:hypothetical protein
MKTSINLSTENVLRADRVLRRSLGREPTVTEVAHFLENEKVRVHPGRHHRHAVHLLLAGHGWATSSSSRRTRARRAGRPHAQGRGQGQRCAERHQHPAGSQDPELDH